MKNLIFFQFVLGLTNVGIIIVNCSNLVQDCLKNLGLKKDSEININKLFYFVIFLCKCRAVFPSFSTFFILSHTWIFLF